MDGEEDAAIADASFVLFGFELRDAESYARTDNASERPADSKTSKCRNDRSRSDQRPDPRDCQCADASKQSYRPAYQPACQIRIRRLSR